MHIMQRGRRVNQEAWDIPKGPLFSALDQTQNLRLHRHGGAVSQTFCRFLMIVISPACRYDIGMCTCAYTEIDKA